MLYFAISVEKPKSQFHQPLLMKLFRSVEASAPGVPGALSSACMENNFGSSLAKFTYYVSMYTCVWLVPTSRPFFYVSLINGINRKWGCTFHHWCLEISDEVKQHRQNTRGHTELIWNKARWFVLVQWCFFYINSIRYFNGNESFLISVGYGKGLLCHFPWKCDKYDRGLQCTQRMKSVFLVYPFWTRQRKINDHRHQIWASLSFLHDF